MALNRSLIMRANRLLGAGLVEANLIKVEDLEAANERLLELLGQNAGRQTCLLNILTWEKKVLREEDMLNLLAEEMGVGLVDLRAYDTPEEVLAEIDLEYSWATWTVPFDREDDFTYLASAYYMSSGVRAMWEERVQGPIIWMGSSMAIIAEFLEKVEADRIKEAGGSRAPFPVTGSRSPFSASGLSSTRPPFPPGGSNPPVSTTPTSRSPLSATGSKSPVSPAPESSVSQSPVRPSSGA